MGFYVHTKSVRTHERSVKVKVFFASLGKLNIYNKYVVSVIVRLCLNKRNNIPKPFWNTPSHCFSVHSLCVIQPTYFAIVCCLSPQAKYSMLNNFIHCQKELLLLASTMKNKLRGQLPALESRQAIDMNKKQMTDSYIVALC